MAISWRQKAQVRRQEWVTNDGYAQMQAAAYALSQEMRQKQKKPALHDRWKMLFNEQGQYPHTVLLSIKRIAAHWPLFMSARTSDGTRMPEYILKELEWLRDNFCAELARECEVPEGGDTYEVSGMIMTDWLRAFGDLVLIYLNDESQFVYEVK